MHEWEAIWRCDREEVWTTETHTYRLNTTCLSKAAAIIEKEIGGNATLISLKRLDV